MKHSRQLTHRWTLTVLALIPGPGLTGCAMDYTPQRAALLGYTYTEVGKGIQRDAATQEDRSTGETLQFLGGLLNVAAGR